ncbi:MAG: VWA domain-containing protein, partial [Bacteroidales bacterium]|nr:VWA domain-containing protein [Bacteroidales bacterium]
MSNFTLNFTHPWLLLLLIPAVALLIFAMLRVPRKYRNSRQRVVSVVLEAIVFLCAILALAGFSFSYVLGNPENEVILLVDVTDSMEDSAENRDNYIRELLEIGAEDGCTMGIVTFGYTQVYAAPLDTKVDKVYDEYKSARLPDTTATDLASAIEYTAKLFSNPLNSKIVVISDGKETDENALSAISYVTSRGTLVESVYIPSQYENDDVQILSVDMPEGKVTKGEAFDMTVNLQSNYDTNVTIIVTDNGETLTDIEYVGYENSDGSFDISEGRTSITLRCILDTKELHSIRIKVGGDAEEYISENNEYYLYFYIDNYNKILIFESQEDQSSDLSDVLREYGTADSDGEEAYDITIKTLKRENPTDLPLTVNELRQYDLVILDNVSNSDMFYSYLSYLDDLSLLDADGDYYQYFYSTSTGDLKGSNDGGLLPRLLNDYVYYYGGGLLTSGGTDEDGNANMYSRSDTYGSVLENMLPVRTINYVPPTGVMFIIDTSGSVTGSVSNAIDGVSNSLSLLGVGGYVGIMDFSAKGNVILPMT